MLQAFNTGAIAMSIPLGYKTDIDGEFQCLKSIAEIRLSDDIMAFLKDANSSMESKGASNP
jgi:hypothetical protein